MPRAFHLVVVRMSVRVMPATLELLYHNTVAIVQIFRT